jgi:hypothetical protein
MQIAILPEDVESILYSTELFFFFSDNNYNVIIDIDFVKSLNDRISVYKDYICYVINQELINSQEVKQIIGNETKDIPINDVPFYFKAS